MGILGKLNWVDFVALIILIRTFYLGIRKGFWVEIFKSCGTFLATIIAFHYYLRVANFLTPANPFLPANISRSLCLIGIFLVILLAFRLLRIGVRTFFKVEVAAGLERWGGAIMGLGRGALIMSALLVVLLLPSTSGYMEEAIKVRSLSGLSFLKITPSIYTLTARFLPGKKEPNEEILKLLR